MTILTVVTDQNNKGLNSFLKPSTDRFNLNLTILIANQDSYKSHRRKDAILHNYLQEIDDEEIILFTDGYDAMFLSGEDEILTKFFKTQKELLFSAEVNCWPDESLSAEYPMEMSQFKYLCSGGFIGKAGFVKRKIEENLETISTRRYAFSNQIYWTEMFLRNTAQIGLDTKCEVFATLSSKEDIEFLTQLKSQRKGKEHVNNYMKLKVDWFNNTFYIKDRRLCVLPTNDTKPCHVHANGFSKVLLDEIARNLDIIPQDPILERFFTRK